MEDQSLARRRLLTGAGAAAGSAVVAGLAMSSPVHAGNGDHRSSAEGSWLATRFDPTDGLERTFVISFARGGVATSIDINPVFLNGAGAWRSRGRHLSARLYYGAPEIPEVAPALTFEVLPVGRVDGDEISGTFTYTVFLAETGDPIGTGDGTWQGTRIKT